MAGRDHPVQPAALHPSLTALAGLVGTWVGEGQGSYPTVAAFAYTEQVTISHVGKPFLAYAQRTWSIDDGRPLHAETGYWRCAPDGTVELVVAHPTGHAELAVGVLAAGGGGPGAIDIDFRSASLACSPSAKEVTEVRRRYMVGGDHLRYELEMAAVNQPLAPHLRGELVRTTGERRA
ncbi:MAG TPA: FABP family protein [Acidimicrobiales bacterium]|nr:FABP family protein [Acidimicrobiales bacterium]